jgi:hypothetical protein
VLRDIEITYFMSRFRCLGCLLFTTLDWLVINSPYSLVLFLKSGLFESLLFVLYFLFILRFVDLSLVTAQVPLNDLINFRFVCLRCNRVAVNRNWLVFQRVTINKLMEVIIFVKSWTLGMLSVVKISNHVPKFILLRRSLLVVLIVLRAD